MNATVADIMERNVVVIGPEDTVEFAKDLLMTHGIQAMPVASTNHGEPLGIISLADLLAGYPADTPISELMTKKLYTVQPDDGVEVAAGVMREHRLHHVLVTKDGQIVGILSTFDLLKLVQERSPSNRQ